MKISPSLTRVVKLVVERRNAEAKRVTEAAVEEGVKKAWHDHRVAALIKEYKAAEQKAEALEEQIKEAGFYRDGTRTSELYNELREKHKPEKTNLDEVLASLATSDEVRAKKVLMALGIQW